jgi:hypothetical protein
MTFQIRRRVRITTSEAFAETNNASSGLGVFFTTNFAMRGPDIKEMMHVTAASGEQWKWVGYRSWRVAASFTISGSITFTLYGNCTVANSGRWGVRLVKRTNGGGDIETLICEGVATTDIPTTSGETVFTLTPDVPVTLAPEERLYLRVFVHRQSAGFDTSTYTFRMDSGAGNSVSRFVTVENVALINDMTTLFARRTSALMSGFRDLLTTMGSSATTFATVNTVSGGTEVPWTLTAGGAALQFITARFRNAWVFDTLAQIWIMEALARESATAANATLRLKMFKRPPVGAETLVWTYSNTIEFGTTLAGYGCGQAQGTINNVTQFVEDDRLVIRPYVIPAPALTMGGSRTCEFHYDGPAVDGGAIRFQILDLAPFKADSEPDREWLPSGMSLNGLGNGQ